ncbi:tRNA lysidine(34) synthetase TilS [Winogradskyella sp. SYSU M77433]|uniref:tRNA lysidine(34) synthetase TilS n=1 Tax=Winogradskyella sp. SYSU M77433 TaxID=3042722 RepID=UPI0024817CCC|nr:tRNA lysidine(34) synthetase TilS [Winogradskyella sp. SYSU M77433]MDH7912444.1 tRNA lysidine(34) synthetase TilS [Winogradskyella sp. SYSU M77433]
MLNAFKNHIEEQFSFLKKSRLVIAISGGIDSVALAHLCHKLNFDFALAHCNFNLRGKESDADEDFVLDLGEQLDVEVFVQNFDTEAYAEENKCSIQMAARELRYDWFSELALQLNFDYILTAHHADDNLETFLINFTRGTGLNGLTGIPELNGNIARPLLPFSRETIEAYAKSENIAWREDSSNSSRKYLRNKLRHDVIPILKEINPNVLDSFQNTLSNLKETEAIVNQSIKGFLSKAILKEEGNTISYAVSEFKKQNNPKAFLFEAFKDCGFAEWNDIEGLLDAETGKFIASSTHKLTKHREFLILSDYHSELVSESQSGLFFTKPDVEIGKIKTPIGILFFDEAEALMDNSKTTIYVDAEKLNYPLELRLWQTGDVFHPIGMKGKKKVSKYLKDEKLTPSEKESTWVLTSENKIVWVVGRRADDRFKVTYQTKEILKIALTK